MSLQRDRDGARLRLKPSILHMVASEVGFAAAVMVGACVISALRGDFDFFVALGFLPLLAIYLVIRVGLPLLIGNEVIILEDGLLFGPGRFAGAAQIPVASLDLARSLSRRWWERINGLLILRSVGGERIILLKPHYDPRELAQFLDAIGGQAPNKRIEQNAVS